MAANVQAPAVGFPPVLSDAVRDAAIEFFGSYCGLQPCERDDKPVESGGPGIMGVISFFGDPVWSVSLVMPQQTAVMAAKAFAGFEISFDSADMGDIVGEMANVMAGDIVARLDARGITAQMSLPTVARGNDVEVLSAANECATRLKFESPNGSFLFRLVKALDRLPNVRRAGA
ncbi:MAG: chemotaxis protein CheX [Planctomycetes bacterium]|nr:chemotaxis protein CheX [Planctomycetota bacterium]